MVHALRGSSDEQVRLRTGDTSQAQDVEPSVEEIEARENPHDPEAQENARVRKIVKQIDMEIRASARELVRQEEERKKEHLLKSKGPFDTNPVRVAFLRDVGTGDTIQQTDTLDLEGRRVLQSTASVIRRSDDVERRKSPTASPHSEDA